MNISDLAMRPPPGDHERHVVFEHFHEIRAARQNGWGWVDIAKSLDRDPRALAAAYHRVESAIKCGKLDAARLGGKTKATPRPSSPPPSRSNFIDLTAPPAPTFGETHHE